MFVVGIILDRLLALFLVLMLIRLVFDWVQMFARSWSPRGIVLLMLEVVYSATDPPIKFVRRLVPPLRIGSLSLDTSFFIVLVVIWVLQSIVKAVFPVG